MSENTAPWAGTPATNNARVSATPTVTRRVIPDLLGHIRKCPFGGLRRRRRGLDLVPPSGAGERTPAHHRGEFLDRPAACGRQRATLARDPMGGKTPSYNDPIVHYPASGGNSAQPTSARPPPPRPGPACSADPSGRHRLAPAGRPSGSRRR